LIRFIRWTAPDVARNRMFMEDGDDKLQMLVLERRDKIRNLARFYVLAIEPTLFGDAALVREWGRIGSRGRRRLDLHDDSIAAKEALDIWLARKVLRGYKPISRSRRPVDGSEHAEECV
jgi:predicted DNA-binding WGR domain protein